MDAAKAAWLADIDAKVEAERPNIDDNARSLVAEIEKLAERAMAAVVLHTRTETAPDPDVLERALKALVDIHACSRCLLDHQLDALVEIARDDGVRVREAQIEARKR